MRFTAKLALSILLSVGVVVALWLAAPRREAAPDAELCVEPSPSMPRDEPLPLAPSVVQERAVAEVERAPVQAPDPFRPAVAKRAPPKWTLHVRARFVDEALLPLERVWFCDGRDGDPSTRSAADGSAELDVGDMVDEQDAKVQLMATHEGRGAWTLTAACERGKELDLGTVVLQPEARIQGNVRDADGAGLEGIVVGLCPNLQGLDLDHLRRNGSEEFDAFSAVRTDVNGAFELRELPAGTWRLWRKTQDDVYGLSEPFELKAGESIARFDFVAPVLLPADTIRGVVVDALGNPLAEADVSLEYKADGKRQVSRCVSANDGSFTIRVVADVPGQLIATHRDRRGAWASLRDVLPGASGLTLRMLEPSEQPTTRLRVRAPTDEAVRNAMVQRVFKDDEFDGVSPQVSREIEPGLYEICAPPTSFTLRVWAPNYLPSEELSFDPQELPRETTVLLEPEKTLQARVMADGKPVARARLRVLRALKPGEQRSPMGSFDAGPQVFAISDESGFVSLYPPSSDAIDLRCEAPGFAGRVVGPIAVDGKLHTIELDAGGTIEGRLLAQDGSGVRGETIGLIGTDGLLLRARTGADGAFRFEHVSAGKWRMSPIIAVDVDAPPATKAPSTEVTLEVTVGATTYRDLSLPR